MKFLPEVDQTMIFTVEDFHRQNCAAVSINSNYLIFIRGLLLPSVFTSAKN